MALDSAAKYAKHRRNGGSSASGAAVNALVAQLVEQLICNQWVGSSSLSGGTIL